MTAPAICEKGRREKWRKGENQKVGGRCGQRTDTDSKGDRRMLALSPVTFN